MTANRISQGGSCKTANGGPVSPPAAPSKIHFGPPGTLTSPGPASPWESRRRLLGHFHLLAPAKGRNNPHKWQWHLHWRKFVSSCVGRTPASLKIKPSQPSCRAPARTIHFFELNLSGCLAIKITEERQRLPGNPYNSLNAGRETYRRYPKQRYKGVFPCRRAVKSSPG